MPEERRKEPRYNEALPVILENATGVTRNVAFSSAFFWTNGTYAIPDQISFWIEMRRPEGMVMLKCRGEVVRTEPRDNVVGVAVRITESAISPA